MSPSTAPQQRRGAIFKLGNSGWASLNSPPALKWAQWGQRAVKSSYLLEYRLTAGRHTVHSLSAGSLPSLSASTAAEWKRSTPRDHDAARDFRAGGQVIRLVISEVRYWRFRGKMGNLLKLWCAQPQHLVFFGKYQKDSKWSHILFN